MEKNDYKYSYSRKVAFKDTDMAGVVHFTQLLAYAEEAEHEALLQAGVEPISGKGGFPKVHSSCDYRSPARYGEVLEVCVGIAELSARSIQWKFALYRADQLVCEGDFVTVLVNTKGMPEGIDDALKAMLASLVI